MAALIHSPAKSDALRSEIDSLSAGGYKSSYGVPPNGWVTAVAKQVVGVLSPARIIPMADGGIGLVFPSETSGRAARVNITNDEEVVVTLSLREEPPVYREVSPSEVVSVVSAFLNH